MKKIALALFTLLWGMVTVYAMSPQEKKADLEELRGRIDGLKKEIGQAEVSRNDASERLRQADRSLSDIQQSLSQTAREKELLEGEIKGLGAETARLRTELEDQRKRLEDLLVQRYLHQGSVDGLRLLLEGDSPAETARQLYYLSHIGRARSERLESVRRTLENLRRVADEKRQREQAVQGVVERHKQQEARLLEERQNRKAMLSKLAGDIEARKKALNQLQRDEQSLAQLVDRLTRLMAERRKLEAERAQRREQEKKDRERKEQERKAVERKEGKTDRGKRDEGEAARSEVVKKAPASASGREQEVAPAEGGVPSGQFGRLRGRLTWPMRGTLAGRFGASREGGGTWKGVFIRANPGSEVRAVAPGRVVFSDWMRGFGNLLIVDHGDDYLTVYGNNEGLLKNVGDSVRGGDVIAKSGEGGASGGGGSLESGLYFELRQRGQALDPVKWMGGR